ncbi:hypothetical protein HT031_006488 [Scenedesmus sp. PABB004]|nr:hypothetical protein HT031_006488 [Scenedesmus sp. PABB004]
MRDVRLMAVAGLLAALLASGATGLALPSPGAADQQHGLQPQRGGAGAAAAAEPQRGGAGAAAAAEPQRGGAGAAAAAAAAGIAEHLALAMQLLRWPPALEAQEAQRTQPKQPKQQAPGQQAHKQQAAAHMQHKQQAKAAAPQHRRPAAVAAAAPAAAPRAAADAAAAKAAPAAPAPPRQQQRPASRRALTQAAPGGGGFVPSGDEKRAAGDAARLSGLHAAGVGAACLGALGLLGCAARQAMAWLERVRRPGYVELQAMDAAYHRPWALVLRMPTGTRTPRSRRAAAMDALYGVMQGLESRLGGGEGVEGIYGSITATGMHKVLECMRHNCGLGRTSALVDVGAGLGRPLLHALLLHGVAAGYGVELDGVKVSKARAFCGGVVDELHGRGALLLAGAAGTDAGALPGAGGEAARDVAAGGSDQARRGGAAALESVGSEPASDAPASDAPATDAPASEAPASDAPDGSEASQGDSRSAASAGSAAGGGGADARAAAAAAARRKAAKGQLLAPQSLPLFTCASIEQVASLEPASHAYSFWEGVPLSGKRAFGRLFRAARTLRAVAVVQRAIRGGPPEAAMAELGFGPLLLIKAFPVNMSGSGRSFQAYVFSKVASPSAELLLRCAGGAAAAEPASPPRGAGAPALEAGLASCTKPRPPREEGEEAAEADDDSDDGGSPPPAGLVQLVTQAQAAPSPGKRLPGGGGGAAGGEGDDLGSPSKRARGGAAGAAGDDHLRAAPSAAAGAGYGLRPRSLSYSASASAGSSGPGGGGGSTRAGRRAAGASSGAPGSGGSSMSVSARGSRSTAASGSRPPRGASGGADTAGEGRGARALRSGSSTLSTGSSARGGRGAEAAAGADVGARPKTQRQQKLAATKQQQPAASQDSVGRALSEARAAVSALAVAGDARE